MGPVGPPETISRLSSAKPVPIKAPASVSVGKCTPRTTRAMPIVAAQASKGSAREG